MKSKKYYVGSASFVVEFTYVVLDADAKEYSVLHQGKIYTYSFNTTTENSFNQIIKEGKWREISEEELALCI